MATNRCWAYFIDIDLVQLNDLIRQVVLHSDLHAGLVTDLPMAIGPSGMDEMKDATVRLLRHHHQTRKPPFSGQPLCAKFYPGLHCGTGSVLLSGAGQQTAARS